jgi:hypothetical protein
MIRLNLGNGIITEYCKGGGGGQMPQPNPKAESDARIAEARANAQMEAERAESDRQRAAQQHAVDVSSSQNRVQSAYNNARDYGTQRLTSRGLTPDHDYGVGAAYDASLNRVRSTLPEIVSDPSTYFTTTLFDDAYNNAREQERRGLTKKANEFVGDNFDYQAFDDTADDPFLDSIIGEQYGTAGDAINRAYARGQLNDQSKQFATGKLDQQKLAGRARAEDLGLGVLQGYRGQLKNEGSRIKSRIGEYDLGDDLNLDTERQKVTDLTGRLKGRLQGDILNNVGGTQFFDTDTILGLAGNKTGVSNPAAQAPVGTGTNTNALLSSFSASTPEDDKSKLGSTGAF